jgi:uncharacterized protein YkwD
MTSVRPVLRRQLIIIVALMLVGSAFTVSPAEAADTRHHTNIRDRMYYLINRQRAQHGVRKLRVNAMTEQHARKHALRMRNRRTVYHSKNLVGQTPRNSCIWAENVARTPASNAARSSMRMFMSSSGHRANILHPRVTHMGIGVAKRGKYTYVVQRFIRRC